MFKYAKVEQKQTSKSAVQKKAPEPTPATPNVTGIPDDMKTRFENLSGFSFTDVRVHYSSDKPVQLQSLAYTQGNQVYVAPGQEKHLRHELGHVVQQKQGHVPPTMQLQGVDVNDNEGLEREADAMAENAMNHANNSNNSVQKRERPILNNSVQFKRYTVSKSTPLKQITQQQRPAGKKTSANAVRDKTLAALRRQYPIESTPENGDEGRGSVFLAEKLKLEPYLTESATVSIQKPYIGAKEAQGETGRSAVGASIANQIKTLTKQDDWIGAHLIKDSWGGAENMMNVVAWRGAAEDKWAQEFETPVDDAFLLSPNTSAYIKVEVTKEDEFIPQTATEESAKKIEFEAGDPRKAVKEVWLKQEIEKFRWKVNTAIETVPTEASARYHIQEVDKFEKNGGTDLESGLIGFDYAVVVAQESFFACTQEQTKKMNGIPDKPPNDSPLDKTLNKAEEIGPVRDKHKVARSRARKDAIYQEIDTLKPDTFEIEIEQYTVGEIVSLRDLGYDITVTIDESYTDEEITALRELGIAVVWQSDLDL